MAKAGSRTTHGLTAEECERLHARHRATPKARVAEVVYAMPDLKAIGDRVAKVLTETVVSAAIGALKGDPRLADWSREGLTLHRDRRAERCLFCEQPLPDDRVAALEAHFSAGHEQVLRRIDEQIRGLEGTSKGPRKNNFLEMAVVSQ